MGVEWDPKKRGWTIRERGIDFADAVSVLEDDNAITIVDNESAPDEERFVTLGLDVFSRVLVVVYVFRGEQIRMISARSAEPHERTEYEAQR